MSTMFLIIAIVASAFLGIQLILLMFGADMDFDSDMDVDATDGGGFMSIRSLTAFFGGFGWAGLAAKQAGWSNGGALSVAAAVGLGMFFMIGFLFIQARKLDKSGNVNYATSVGTQGSVYLTVQPGGRRGGKVEVNASGRASVVNAVTDVENPIPANSRVVIVDVLDATTLLVRPV